MSAIKTIIREQVLSDRSKTFAVQVVNYAAEEGMDNLWINCISEKDAMLLQRKLQAAFEFHSID